MEKCFSQRNVVWMCEYFQKWQHEWCWWQSFGPSSNSKNSNNVSYTNAVIEEYKKHFHSLMQKFWRIQPVIHFRYEVLKERTMNMFQDVTEECKLHICLLLGIYNGELSTLQVAMSYVVGSLWMIPQQNFLYFMFI